MKRILVALDGSDRAALVLSAAARLAELAGAKLVLFRAIGVPAGLPRAWSAMLGTRAGAGSRGPQDTGRVVMPRRR